MKSWMIALVAMVILVGCGQEGKITVTVDPNNSLLEIDWPMKPGWENAYGANPESQRDYNFWLLGKIAQNQKELNAKYEAAFNAIDPNLLADPNAEGN